MDVLSKLALGWQMALTGPHLLAMVCGSLLGLLNGLLERGLSVPALMALLLPLVPELEAGSALILLMAVCGSGQFARAGAAKGGSVAAAAAAAAVLASLAIGLLAPWLTALGFHFDAAESFSLMLLCLALACALTAGSLLNSLAMAVLGLLLTQIGHDPIFGSPRFLVELPQLSRGIGVVPLAIGLTVGADLMIRMEQSARPVMTPAVVSVSRSRRSVLLPMLRGTGVGLLLGLLPGGGAAWASQVASQLERHLLGDVPAASGPEIVLGSMAAAAAEQAATRVAFVPMLALGVPVNATVALLAVALSMKGMQAGPLLMTGRPELFWGLLASIGLSAAFLLIASVATARWWPALSASPQRSLAMPLLLAACLGVFCMSTTDPTFDLAVMTLATFGGYLLRKLNCQTSPLLLAFVLGPALEDSLRRALQRADGDWAALVDRPLSAILLVLAALTVAAAMPPWTRRRRDAVFGAGG